MTLFIFFLVLLKSKREGKKLSGTLRMYIQTKRKNIIEREKEISLSCLFRDIYDRDMHNLKGKHHLLGALTES